MLKVNIICIGKIKEKYFSDAIAEYSKRLSAFCKFSVIELAEERLRGGDVNEAKIREVLNAEGKRILQKPGSSDYIVAMCVEGKQKSSEELAEALSLAANSGKSTVDFIIGGSYGLSGEVKQRADLRLSMSKMTFPHQMARMILSEQIYRAFEIMNNGKYHK